MGIEEFILQREEARAIEELKTKFVKNLIKLTDFSNDRIANFVDVNVAFVEKISADSPIKLITI